MAGWFPVPSGLAGYRWGWLRFDVTAGLAVAAVAIPSAIAYPAIAGLPAETGLYASVLSLVGYALAGPSRKLMAGPDAATMTVLAAVLASMPLADPGDRVAAAAALALIVGVLCIAAGQLNLGVVAAFLSRPILIGFISGISISILIGQIGRFTGVRIEADGLVGPLLEIIRKVDLVHWPSVIFGAAMFALLVLLERLRSPVPGPLVVVIFAGIASALFDFEGKGMKVIGDLPSSLPAISLPDISRLPFQELLFGAGAIWLVSVSSGLVAARSFGAKDGFEVDANREFTGLGAGNIASGLFGGFPVTVSDSRTAINLSAGGRSQVAGLVAAAALTVLLLFLNHALRVIPSPALGAILAFAALSLIDIRGLREIWRVSPTEFIFAGISMWGAISLGVLRGVVIAIGGTLLYVLLKEMRPRDAMLGRVPGRPGFYKLHRIEEARPLPGTRGFVLDAGAIAQIDSTAAAMFLNLRDDLAKKGLSFGFAELNAEPREILTRAGLFEPRGATPVFDDLEDAARAFERERA
jgi:MFS superfamily sulfate permease-like transporter